MGILDSVKKFVAPEDSEEIYDEELDSEELKQLSHYEKTKNTNVNGIKSNSKMVLFEPRDFDETEEIAYHLKLRRACVINLHRVSKEYAQRIIDFLSGSIYALDGTISKIGENVILCAPKEMGVEGDITLTKE